MKCANAKLTCVHSYLSPCEQTKGGNCHKERRYPHACMLHVQHGSNSKPATFSAFKKTSKYIIPGTRKRSSTTGLARPTVVLRENQYDVPMVDAQLIAQPSQRRNCHEIHILRSETLCRDGEDFFHRRGGRSQSRSNASSGKVFRILYQNTEPNRRQIRQWPLPYPRWHRLHA